MTMPHLMNCSHGDEGWCLECVNELHGKHEQLTQTLPKINHGERAVLGMLVNDPDGNLCKIIEISVTGTVGVKYMNPSTMGGVQCPEGMMQCGRPGTRYTKCK